jgi:hypothetical protein
MKKISILLLIVLIFTACVKDQSAPKHENVEETILILEGEALDQWSSGNPLGFGVHFADDGSYMDDIGAQNRIVGAEATKEYLASLDGKIPPHEYEIVDPLVQVYGDVAILTFQYHSKIDTMSGPPWKATSVYHFNDSTWQMVHANWSLVKTQ